MSSSLASLLTDAFFTLLLLCVTRRLTPADYSPVCVCWHQVGCCHREVLAVDWGWEMNKKIFSPLSLPK